MKNKQITLMRQLRRPPDLTPCSRPDWPEVPQGFIFMVRQDCLTFGHDRHVPAERRPVLTIVKRDGLWFVLPGTRKNQQDSPEFFHIPADSVDCQTRDAERCDQFFYAGYEAIDLPSSDARDFGLLHQRLRLALGQWLASYGRQV